MTDIYLEQHINNKWYFRFMMLAEHVASWSKDPRTKVGAVLARGNRDVVFGYNGFPRYVADDPARYSNREYKHKVVLHAELNAILNARRDLTGYSIFVWPLPPCTQCASAIIQSGITEVVSRALTQTQREKHENYLEDWDIAKTLFKEAGLRLVYQQPGRPGRFKIAQQGRYPPPVIETYDPGLEIAKGCECGGQGGCGGGG